VEFCQPLRGECCGKGCIPGADLSWEARYDLLRKNHFSNKIILTANICKWKNSGAFLVISHYPPVTPLSPLSSCALEISRNGLTLNREVPPSAPEETSISFYSQWQSRRGFALTTYVFPFLSGYRIKPA